MMNFCSHLLPKPSVMLLNFYILKCTVDLSVLSLLSIKLFKVGVGNSTPTFFKLVAPKLECLYSIIVVKVVGNEVLDLSNVVGQGGDWRRKC